MVRVRQCHRLEHGPQLFNVARRPDRLLDRSQLYQIADLLQILRESHALIAELDLQCNRKRFDYTFLPAFESAFLPAFESAFLPAFEPGFFLRKAFDAGDIGHVHTLLIRMEIDSQLLLQFNRQIQQPVDQAI